MQALISIDNRAYFVYYNVKGRRRKCFCHLFLNLPCVFRRADHMDDIHSGHRDRLKERFLRSSSAFDDLTVLELLLTYAIPRRDTRPIASALIEKYGNLQSIASADVTELTEQCGVSAHTAMLIKMLPELSKRVLPKNERTDVNYFESEAASKFLISSFEGLKQEFVMLLCLDENGIMLDATMLYRGSINGADFRIRDITERALMYESHDVIIAHNHPSGPMIPSRSDLDSTARIISSLSSNGITLHEHYLIYRDYCIGILSGD